jgi:hypothetical protein
MAIINCLIYWITIVVNSNPNTSFMKTKQIIVTLALLVAALSSGQVSINVNIGSPPVWAPTAPSTVEYYYLPDIGVYYDVPARTYIYFGNGAWRRSTVLPSRYRGYNLAQGHTIYLNDYHGRTPYAYNQEHKLKYKGDYRWKEIEHDNGNRGRKPGRNEGKGNRNRPGERKEHGRK